MDCYTWLHIVQGHMIRILDYTSYPNINYSILHDIIQNAKTKHMPYKTVKLKKTQGQEILMDNTRYPPINPIQG